MNEAVLEQAVDTRLTTPEAPTTSAVNALEQADEVITDEELVSLTQYFINKYRPALEELAK